MSNPSPSPSRWQAPLLLAIAIFGPPTAFLTFAHALTQNPVLITLLIVFYETGLTLAALFGKVWQKLVDPWLEQIASWIRTRVQWLVSHPHKTYCQYMFHDVKGLDMQTTFNLALDQVFVELSMVPTLPDQTSANPLQLPKSLSGGSHPIWDYLSAPVLREQHLVLIGPPGSGKSTLLKHTALALIGHKHHRASKDSKLPHRLPVLLFLREYADSIGQNADFSLENAVSAHCKMRWKQTLPPAWMRYHLMKGDCLVLLDGLDEVADAATRKQVVDWVRDQIDAYPKNRFVVTSRPHGFKSYPLTGVTVLEVRPFTPKQIEQFVHNWYTANEIMSAQKDDPDVRLKATNRAEDLLGRLRNAPALYDLAINPLLLTMIMIATAHRYRDTLPGKRVTLYAEICEVFLGKRQEAKGLALELTAAQKRQVLQPLAYFMMEKGIREIAQNEACKAIQPSLAQVSSQMTPEEFLQMVENTSGLFLERDPEIYSFAHLTFQEYLAAVYLKEEGREALLVAHVADTWWHETIRLYCAQADVSAIITACLSRGRLSVPTLTLAIECY
ncbi:MAG TPA: NACHT domain-containing protein, partial [Ktedonobacteraceae bacterium]|nr:NACHT domain-containing protein [Ktedonobacteraceae bacterium]